MNSPRTDQILEFMKGLEAPATCEEIALLMGLTTSQVRHAMSRLHFACKVENVAANGHPGEYIATRPNKIATIRMREWKPLVLPSMVVRRPVIDVPGCVVTRRLTGERL